MKQVHRMTEEELREILVSGENALRNGLRSASRRIVLERMTEVRDELHARGLAD